MSDSLLHGQSYRADFKRQRRIVDALYRSTHSELVERIETNISTILLFDEFAYKLKKPVCLNFVDYTALEARRFFCEEEVRLNKRFAPDLYLACVPISGSISRPVLEGGGKPIEYAVKMKRFDRRFQGNVLVQTGGLNALLIDALADTIARFHSEAPQQSELIGSELVSGIQSNVSDNFQDVQALFSRSSTTRQKQCADIVVWTKECLRSLKGTFLKRAAEGFVRECHGDLHLSNLVKSGDKWIAFDCIEFNRQLRWIDVMSDLAFPAMDLAARQVPHLAYRLLNRYFEVTGDYAGLKVLRFYLVYRALIRSKVLALGTISQGDALTQRLMEEQQGEDSGRRACRYLSEAHRWARSRIRPGLIITHGISGSGKSYASKWIADHFGYIRIRSDVERKRLHGIAIDRGSGSSVGSGIYSTLDDQITYRKLAELAECALSGGWPVILDATFLKRNRRDMARRLSQRLHCPFTILVLTAPIEVMRVRLENRRGLDASEAGADVMEAQLTHYEPLAPSERFDAIETESDTKALAVAVRRIEGRWWPPRESSS